MDSKRGLINFDIDPTQSPERSAKSCEEYNEQQDGDIQDTNKSNESDENVQHAANLEYRFMSGLRSDSRLLHVLEENQLYRRNTSTKKNIIYKCRVPKCKSRVYLNSLNQCRRVANFKGHNHGDVDTFIEGLELKTKIKTACVTSTTSEKTKSTRDIFFDYLSE